MFLFPVLFILLFNKIALGHCCWLYMGIRAITRREQLYLDLMCISNKIK